MEQMLSTSILHHSYKKSSYLYQDNLQINFN